ncbi:DUF3365 domain-containing protein [Proteobacteria bacterium 005FR1]|nr:DUF3365 domain-containing protein [Proteobacteria bacterium 005FR1]
MQLSLFAIGLSFMFRFNTAQADTADHDGPADLESEAKRIVQQFVGELKPTLQKAMSEGGPAVAIEVCSQRAPAIAQQLSEKTDWQVSRVSLQPRNRNTAMPDAWEREQLKEFDHRQAAGEQPANIHVAQQVGTTFRYMQAQGVEPLCLSCHGEKLAPAVEQALQLHYSGDTATGYRLGQVRGAISLQKPLSAE